MQLSFIQSHRAMLREIFLAETQRRRDAEMRIFCDLSAPLRLCEKNPKPCHYPHNILIKQFVN